jgi:hypothetical protein
MSLFSNTSVVKPVSKTPTNKFSLIKVIDITTNIIKIFIGNKEAANFLDIGESTLRRYKKIGKLYKNKYLIYNSKGILNKADLHLNVKHLPKTLLNFESRILNPKALIDYKLAKIDKAPLLYLRRVNHLLATGHITTVINKENNTVKVYDSIRAASRDIDTNHITLINYINSGKLLKGTYLITRKIK